MAKREGLYSFSETGTACVRVHTESARFAAPGCMRSDRSVKVKETKEMKQTEDTQIDRLVRCVLLKYLCSRRFLSLILKAIKSLNGCACAGAMRGGGSSLQRHTTAPQPTLYFILTHTYSKRQ